MLLLWILETFSRKGPQEDAATSSAPYLTTEEDAIASSQDVPASPSPKKQHLSASEKRKQYRAKLSYRPEWEKKYPWVSCTDVSKGMFCTICQKWGRPTPGSRGQAKEYRTGPMRVSC